MRYQFKESDIQGHDFGESFLFYEPKFLALHADIKQKSFFICAGRKIVALINFGVCGDKFISPVRGTFGGIHFFDQVPIDVLTDFLLWVGARASQQGIRDIEVRLPNINLYPTEVALQLQSLSSGDYEVGCRDIGHTVDLLTTRTKPHKAIDRQRRRSFDEGAVADILPPADLPAVYDVIFQNRIQNGHPMTMSLDSLQKMQQELPGVMRLFGVKVDDVLVSAAVTLKIDRSVMYVFYWGDLRRTRDSFSSIVPLFFRIKEYGVANGFAVLDLGTSSLSGEINEGLATFKRRLGATAGEKLTMQCSLREKFG